MITAPSCYECVGQGLLCAVSRLCENVVCIELRWNCLMLAEIAIVICEQ